MIKFALPGVHEFLEDILAAENLSEKGENLRLEFVSILKNLGSAPQSDEINTVTSNDKESPQQHSLLYGQTTTLFSTKVTRTTTQSKRIGPKKQLNQTKRYLFFLFNVFVNCGLMIAVNIALYLSACE